MKEIKNLNEILKNINPVLSDKEYIFALLKNKNREEVTLLDPFSITYEQEGISVIIEKQTAEINEINFETVYNKITLQVFSSLDAVGLTATVSSALAEKNIPANVVAAYNHDYIFVPSSKASQAMQVLNSLSE